MGRYLAEELPRIYAEESAAVVVFVSAEYAIAVLTARLLPAPRITGAVGGSDTVGQLSPC